MISNSTMAVLVSTQNGESNDAVVGDIQDPEKGDIGNDIEDSPVASRALKGTVLGYLSAGSVELRGVLPVPLEERTSTRYSTYFSIWFCMNVNVLAITFGMLGPTYGLGLRDCTLVIIFFCLLTAAIPAYLGTLGPKTGLRQMIQARFSFGRYIVSVPVILNLATLTGFCVITCVIGGQCLSAVSDGSVNPVVGIVIIGVLSLFVSFWGYNVLHIYERFAWIPALIAIIITTGSGGSHLHQQVPTEVATAAGVFSFGMSIASYMIPFATLASDFTTYLNPQFPSWKLFLIGFAGLVLPNIPLMVLGAAIQGALLNVPVWKQGYETNSVGGVLAAMLLPTGGFGKFVVVLLSLSLLGNNAATMYSITLNFQILVPQLVRIPRYIFSIVITAILIPVSIKAAAEFFQSLQNFIALIAYWSAAFVAVLITEHVIFRRGRYDTYSHDAWNTALRLPWGAAALTASVLSFALVIPSIAQVWFMGPIAKKTGDIGFELAFVTTAVLYLPLRALEKRVCGR
ncbi:permease for cytosine/purines, uracil, thiamine, allantoin-domain-containing protein [Xylaria curta]|nr:permease for cytosine/purines, uracil, thiamine, allantoin-domain-containing protein [Xylaria curta]